MACGSDSPSGKMRDCSLNSTLRGRRDLATRCLPPEQPGAKPARRVKETTTINTASQGRVLQEGCEQEPIHAREEAR